MRTLVKCAHVENPCLRHCGICAEDQQVSLNLATFEAETEDVNNLYDIASSRDEAINDHEAIKHAYVLTHEGQRRICIYTDGSCKLPRHNMLAHAGWGLAVSSENNPYNQSGPLRDTVQTSYRAELRAIAQALAICKCPCIIIPDC